MTLKELEAIEARCLATSDGPWVVEGSNIVSRSPRTIAEHVRRAAGLPMDSNPSLEDLQSYGVPLLSGLKTNDLEFAAHARVDVVELITEISELKLIIESQVTEIAALRANRRYERQACADILEAKVAKWRISVEAARSRRRTWAEASLIVATLEELKQSILERTE